MPRSIQIRDVDDDVYEALAKRAAEVGLSVPEYLRRKIARLAAATGPRCNIDVPSA
ncbi:MAG TPA: hypothetical protein P5193_06160 [Microthrixaceae bacterium]|nr:hypothetical protein [Microthrixaceae bacterium]MCB9374899.1 hypothetical protein [Microthrixaceae bacterium]MCB9400952.1 hypothetical protein [Microthrixaceae bacterium]MCO5304933.1 hypothetical protein [Microthrixaceae bacterium]HMU79181.1 hypothetical protein [Microthrixaceae bacterium]